MAHYDYDLAMSFAREDRAIAEQYVKPLADAGYRIFHHLWEEDTLLGKALLERLDFVYRLAARYCIVFISSDYARKAWTTFELRSALNRALEDKDEYILPLRIDDTALPGLDPGIAYLDLRTNSVDYVASVLRRKLGTPFGRVSITDDLYSGDKQRRLSAMAMSASRMCQVWLKRDCQYLDEVKILLRSDPDPEIRARSAWALDNLRDTSAKDILLDALNDNDRNVRSNAGWALVHLGSDVSEDVERILQQSKSEDTRKIARLILQKI